jgi:hypothetical protein
MRQLKPATRNALGWNREDDRDRVSIAVAPLITLSARLQSTMWVRMSAAQLVQ